MSTVEHGTMDQLRTVLFDTLDGLKAGTVDPNRAKAIAQVAQTLLNSVETQIAVARIEVETKRPFLPGMPLVDHKPKRANLDDDPALSAAARANRARG